mgnify:CR=1 FL=1
MTVVELMIGLISFSVLGVAVASLMSAAGDGWQARDDHQEQVQSSRALNVHIRHWVQQCRRIVAAIETADRADVVLWTHDDADTRGVVNASEVRVVSYEADAGAIVLYAAEASASDVLTPAYLATPAGVAAFRGRADVQRYELAAGVEDCDVWVAGDPSYTYLEMKLAMASGSGAAGAITLVAAHVRSADLSVDFEQGDGGDDQAEAHGAWGLLGGAVGDGGDQ